MRSITLSLILAVLVIQASAQAPLVSGPTIALPRVEGRIDHLAFDKVDQRVFVAARGNNTVEILDLSSGKAFKSLPGFQAPQGIAVDPDDKIVAVANGDGDGVQLITPDGRVMRSVRLGDDSDNVRYDGSTRRFYVGFGDGAIAAIDAITGKVLGQVALRGHPESFQLERSGPRIFVNVPDAGVISVIDRTSMRIVATWRLTAASGNFPMALDEQHHRLFIGCRGPAKALVYDIASGRQTASFDIVDDTDDLFYDPDHQRVFVSGGGGYIDVMQATDANQFTRLAHLVTAPGARTSLFVAELNELFLAVPHRGAQSAEVRTYRTE